MLISDELTFRRAKVDRFMNDTTYFLLMNI